MRNPQIMICAAPGVSDPETFIPQRKSPGAVGYDVKACWVQDAVTRNVIEQLPTVIKPGQKKLIGCGYIAAVPDGVDCAIRPRSGLAAKSEIILSNGPGTVDPDYRGEIGCLLYNTSEKDFTVNRGDRIGQLIFTPVLLPEFYLVDSVDKLPTTLRGTGGFGSTGIGLNEGISAEQYYEVIKKNDIHYLRMALLEGTDSNCVRGCKMDSNGIPIKDDHGNFIGSSRKIGAIITRGNSIVSTGHNAQYPGAKACAEIGCIREKLSIASGTQLEMCQAIHAETMAINNALMNGIMADSGCTIYCTSEPCLLCARQIAGHMFEALVVIQGSYSTSEGLNIVRSSGTIVRTIDIKELD